jgi:effector-binding domain-containing protein
MRIKEIKPINFLFYRTETKLPDLAPLIPKAKELFKEAVKLDLHITGPLHWHYFGFTGDPEKAFTLEISLPVSNILADYDGLLHFKRTQPFRSVNVIHEGSWMNMLDSYTKLMEFIQKNNLQPSGMNREVYINSDFADPEANVTEIQFGIL